MGQIPINFFTEDISFNIKQRGLVRTWIRNTIIAENHRLRLLNFIFCSDAYLLSINQQYLNHDTYTDIITFDNSDIKQEIVGDIFISLDRIRENAKELNINEIDELHRVMIHGTLHLLGYPDKGKSAKALMTEKEDLYLSKRAF
ncbi:rRNA maturation RNase YbeY [Daejeonella sp.]|uniref:rRNA maturation RNase YbeY n=1 Tax=Daejeonella sp. TaxID=2805397 RepID=UPI00271F5301|nr:rRNA maturation RNase YbeY [Daejeonella sp.]MDO8993832.1 rRNA maturation RNase YbeY [Daejeonella sp.]MDP2413977.1 rRNA maturation RNase YbeY [Daejeonella sp.]